MKVYQRAFKTGTRWACDIHVAPAGEAKPQRFRLVAPPSVTSRSGAERWARAQFTAIAANGPPAGSKRAKAKAADLAAQAERERVPTLGEWWPQYEEQLAAERRKYSGQLTRRSLYSRWLAPLANLDLRACCSELTIRRLRSTIAASPRKISAKTNNGILITFLAILRRAAQTLPHLGLVVPTVKPIRVDAVPDVTGYAREDTLLMLDACTPRDRAAMLLMLDAGLRAGEVCALQWADIDGLCVTVQRAAYRDQVASPKSGKPRTVPLTLRLAEALRVIYKPGTEWVCSAPIRGGSCAYSTLQQRIRRVCQQAGVQYLGLHALRHTYATEQLRSGVDIRTLQDRLGHSDIKVTSVYLHATAASERRGMDAFEARLQAPAAPVTDLALARKRRGKS